jgi:hypothetical protein
MVTIIIIIIIISSSSSSSSNHNNNKYNHYIYELGAYLFPQVRRRIALCDILFNRDCVLEFAK